MTKLSDAARPLGASGRFSSVQHSNAPSPLNAQTTKDAEDIARRKQRGSTMTYKPTDTEMLSLLDKWVAILRQDSPEVVVEEVEVSTVQAIRDRLASLMPTKDAEELATPEENIIAMKIVSMCRERVMAHDSMKHAERCFDKIVKEITAAEQRGYERGKADVVPDAKELHYLRSIKSSLEEYKMLEQDDIEDRGFQLGDQILGDNLDWLDCYIEKHSRIAAAPSPAKPVKS